MQKKLGPVIIYLIAVVILALGSHSMFMSTVYDNVATIESDGGNIRNAEKLEDGTVELGLFALIGSNTETLQNPNSGIYRYRYWMIGIGLVMIFGTLWIAALNYLVASKTKALIEANEQLSHSQNQNKAMINAIPDAIFLLDHETRVLECNIVDSDLPFSNKSDLMMRKLSEVMPKPYGEKLIEAIKKVSMVNELIHMEMEISVESARKFYEIRLIRSGKNEVIAIFRDMTANYENLENIKYLSYHDQLTGLFNRYMFEEELDRLDVNRNFPLSIIMADVNGLKLVNDCFGHPAGDQLLLKFSEVLKSLFRADDIICRIGGDEFVIVLPQTTFEVANQLSKKVSVACDEIEIFNLNLSVAFGCATKLSSRDAIKEVLKYAEDQMYKSKLFESPKIKERMIDKLLKSLFESIDSEAVHSETVETYSAFLGNAIGLNPTELETLKTAAKNHDIGKIAIDQSILNKHGLLTTSEMETLRVHPDIGYRILSAVNEMSECADVILAHHERWDGLGYPKGLSGDHIPLMSRIIAIADAYAAMTKESHYKEIMTPFQAITEIEKYSGIQFDPILGRQFATLMKDKM